MLAMFVALAVWIVVLALPEFRGIPRDWQSIAIDAQSVTHAGVIRPRAQWTLTSATIHGSRVWALSTGPSARPTRYRVHLDTRQEWRTLSGLRAIVDRAQ